ncbi:hypothetical protein [Endozoicomonas sp. YOMI1]|uniref:hypothetical protein n=1 Tax=Endozoicomonas sp. YOMI1 TaxID=2828739 RepID=UPI0021485B98|nr:hypothetical protein [Endozoicomonas sp. YOMI1]
MAGEASSHLNSINANHLPLTSTLKDTAGKSISGLGKSTSQSLSVADIHHNPGESLTISHDKTCQKACERSEKQKACKRAWAQSEKGKAYQKAYRESEKGKAYQKAYQKFYVQSEKGKASRRAYAQSKKGKACQKAYEQSEKRRAYKKAYQKTHLAAYQKAYQKAYYRAFKNTGDKEQAKIAARQAANFLTELNKTKNNKVESTSISPLLPAFQVD